MIAFVDRAVDEVLEAVVSVWSEGPACDVLPPMHERTVGAYAQDGRWFWHEFGVPKLFERLDRYDVSRVRDRFDRSLLVGYLAAMGIHVDDPAFFSTGTGVRQRLPRPG